jgi:starch synthase
VLNDGAPGCVAIFPWGDLIQDFLTPIDLDARGSAERMTGGGRCGYVAARNPLGCKRPSSAR